MYLGAMHFDVQDVAEFVSTVSELMGSGKVTSSVIVDSNSGTAWEAAPKPHGLMGMI